MFRFFKYTAFSSIFFLNHSHADFYQDFAKANHACDAYLAGHTDDWQTPAALFIQGFNDMNGRLQAIWRGLIGNGEAGFGWNGVPCDKKGTHKNGYNKRDCPIIMTYWLWESGHIAKYKVPNSYSIYTVTEAILPDNSNISDIEFSNKKGQFKRQILNNIFHKRNLRECALFLNDKFCKPVANLLATILKKNKTFTQAQCAQLLTLYGAYDRLDNGFPQNSQYHYQSTKDIVHKFLADYYFNFLNYDPDTQAWLTQLIQNYQYPYGDAPSIGQYNIDLTLFLNNLIFKMKNEGPIQDFFLMNLLNVIVCEWYEKDNKTLSPYESYIDSYHLDFQSFNTAMKQVMPQGGRGSPALY